MNNYRLFRICTTGPYFDLFFNFLKGYEELTFEETLQKCREYGFLYPGGLKKSLENLGADVMETIVDAEPLQKKWLSENGFPNESVFEKNDVFFQQLKSFKPDIVYFQTFFALAPEVRRRIKEECPNVRLVVGHRGFPIEDCTGYEDVDAVFLGYPRFHDRWHSVGVKTFFHLHGFDADMLPAIERHAKELVPIDFTFIGSTGWGFGPHDGRYYDLRKVMEATNLTVFGNEPVRNRTIVDQAFPSVRARVRNSVIECLTFFPHFGLQTIGDAAQKLDIPVLKRAVEAAVSQKKFGRDSAPPKVTEKDYWFHREKPIVELYPTRTFPPRFGLDYFALLAASKLTWNRHLEMDGAGANMRLFEACGVGTCQLVDAREEVLAAYDAELEIATYKSIDECIEKAKWLLDNTSEREKIGRAGQQRTLRDHTVQKRAGDLHEHLLSLLRA